MAGRAHLVADELERLAAAGFDDLAQLHPADRPAGVLAEHADADHLVGVDRAQVAGPVADLELLGHLQAGLQDGRDVHRHVVAADRQDTGVERRAVREQGQVDRARPDVGNAHAEVLLGLGQDGLGRGQRAGDELVDLDVGGDHALLEVLDRGGRGGDDVGLDLEPDRAHAERVLDPFLAVDDEAPGQDVEHFAVRRDRDGPGHLGGPVDVFAADLSIVAADATAPREFCDSTFWPPTPTNARSIFQPDRRSACSTAWAIELIVCSMLTTTPFFRPVAGTVPLPMIVKAPSALTSPIRAQTLVVPTSMPTRTASRSTLSSSPLQEVAPDQGEVLEDPGPEGHEGHEVQVQSQPIADEGE